MKSVGIGNVLLKLSLASMSAADITRLSGVTLLLLDPYGVLSEVPVPADGLDKIGRTAAAKCVIKERGVYRLGCRLHFTGDTSITATSSSKFMVTDGMA